jgi:hypothetical protein
LTVPSGALNWLKPFQIFEPASDRAAAQKVGWRLLTQGIGQKASTTTLAATVSA